MTAKIELYLIRHAETVMNTNLHLIGGRSNETPLTEKGIEQARELGRVMRMKEITPTKLFASPALRTLDTARYSLAEMGIDVEPIIHESLQELGQGPYEGRLREEVYTPDVLSEIKKLGKDFKLEGGESMNEVGLRMFGWMDETFAGTNENSSIERYFVYTHGGAIRYLVSHILGWSHRQTLETFIENTTISLLVRKEGDWSVEYVGQHATELVV